MDEKSYLVSVPTPLGIGFKRVESGFVVSKVKPGGNAEEEGSIEVGTKILTVNGNVMDGLLLRIYLPREVINHLVPSLSMVSYPFIFEH